MPIQTQVTGAPSPAGAFAQPNFFTGQNFQNQSNAFTNMAMQAQMANALNLEQGQKEMSEYDKDELLRAAKRAAGIAEADATTSTVGRKKAADTSSAESKAKLESDTLSSKIDSTNSDNEQKMHANAADALYESLGAVEAAGPAWKAAAMERLKGVKIHPAVAEQLKQAQDPNQYAQIVNQYREAVSNRISTMSGDRSQKQKDDAAMGRTQVSAGASIEVAKINAAARREEAALRGTTEKVSDSYQKLGAEYARKALAATDPETKAEYQKLSNGFFQDAQNLNAAGRTNEPVLTSTGIGQQPKAPAATSSIMGGAPAPQGTGKTISVGGQSYEVIAQNPDGSVKIRDPKTGRTGTVKP